MCKNNFEIYWINLEKIEILKICQEFWLIKQIFEIFTEFECANFENVPKYFWKISKFEKIQNIYKVWEYHQKIWKISKKNL
jgi:hypothetical protein